MPISTIKLILIALFIASAMYVHYRGRVRHKFWRQASDHSTIMAPINSFMYLFSSVPTTPYIDVARFPALEILKEHWQEIRDEGVELMRIGQVKASDQYNDIGFNSFFKSGWKRFYLKWYDESHPSAQTLCPKTVALLRQLPQVKAAMFTELPPGSRLVRHRDPYAGSLRYHLGLGHAEYRGLLYRCRRRSLRVARWRERDVRRDVYSLCREYHAAKSADFILRYRAPAKISLVAMVQPCVWALYRGRCGSAELGERSHRWDQ